MIDKIAATQIRDEILSAIEALGRALNIAHEHCNAEEFASIKKTIGISIGNLDYEILFQYLYAAYPDLDNIK
jgi:hypothetical protein